MPLLNPALAEFLSLAQAAIVADQLRRCMGADGPTGQAFECHVRDPLADAALFAGVDAVAALPDDGRTIVLTGGGLRIRAAEPVAAPDPAPPEPQPTPTPLLNLTLHEAREQFEAAFLSVQLEKHRGNIAATAKAIGMERSAFHRKVGGFGINFRQFRAHSPRRKTQLNAEGTA